MRPQYSGAASLAHDRLKPTVHQPKPTMLRLKPTSDGQSPIEWAQDSMRGARKADAIGVPRASSGGSASAILGRRFDLADAPEKAGTPRMDSTLDRGAFVR